MLCSTMSLGSPKRKHPQNSTQHTLRHGNDKIWSAVAQSMHRLGLHVSILSTVFVCLSIHKLAQTSSVGEICQVPIVYHLFLAISIISSAVSTTKASPPGVAIFVQTFWTVDQHPVDTPRIPHWSIWWLLNTMPFLWFSCLMAQPWSKKLLGENQW